MRFIGILNPSDRILRTAFGDWLDATFGFDCDCIVSKFPGIEFCTGRCYQLGPVSLSSTTGIAVATVLTFLAGLLAGWLAPAAASVVGQALDTAAFFSIAFWRSSDAFMAANWMEIAVVDYVIKLAVSLLLFVPAYGVALAAIVRVMRQGSVARAGAA